MSLQTNIVELIKTIKNDTSKLEELIEVLNEESILTIHDRDKLEPIDFQNLIKALAKNKSITHLGLNTVFDTNGIDIESIKALSELLKNNHSLTRLDLSGNKINSESARALAEMLKINTTLAYLNLGHNIIGPQGIVELAIALKDNTELSSLNLAFNNIEAQGAIALSRALESNDTLENLDLSGNMNIEYEAGKLLIETVLNKNKRVTSFKLGFVQDPTHSLPNISFSLKLKKKAIEAQIKAELNQIKGMPTVLTDIIGEYLAMPPSPKFKANLSPIEASKPVIQLQDKLEEPKKFLSRFERFRRWIGQVLNIIGDFVKKIFRFKSSESLNQSHNKTKEQSPPVQALNDVNFKMKSSNAHIKPSSVSSQVSKDSEKENTNKKGLKS